MEKKKNQFKLSEIGFTFEFHHSQKLTRATEDLSYILNSQAATKFALLGMF